MNDDAKSPISLVFEKAFKHDLKAIFSDGEGRGPPHMRVFRVECQIGDQFKTSGEGSSKKVCLNPRMVYSVFNFS